VSADFWSPGPRLERRQLLVQGAALGALAAVLHVLAGAVWAPWILGSLGVAGLAGAALYPGLGRGVFLVYALLGRALGRALSFGVLCLAWAVGIAAFGSVLRLAGMNRLERDFARCRARDSMLVPAPPTDLASFERMS
jgi:hypothetical protein